MGKREKIRQNRILKASETAIESIFLVLAGLYLLRLFFGTTTFSVSVPVILVWPLLYVLGGVALMRLAFVVIRERKPWALLSLPLAGMYCLCYRSNHYSFLLYLAALTVGFVGINYRKILWMYLATVGIAFCVAITAGITGTITNLVYVRVGEGIRSAWGISYPTDFASLALFLALYLWAAWDGLPDWAMLILCAGPILLARFIAHSNTSFICGIVFLFAILCHWLDTRALEPHSRCPRLRRCGRSALTASFPVFALAMFALMFIYSRGLGIGYRINNLMSDRLELSVSAWRKYGLKAFGTAFRQAGNGYNTISPSNYNFVDSSYPLILLRYGWVTFVAVGASWTCMICKALRRGNRKLALVMGIIAFHSFSEHHFMGASYNLLVALPFADLEPRDSRESSKTGVSRLLPGIVTAVLVGGVGWLAMPRLLTQIKTVYELLGWTGGKTHALAVIGSLLILFACVGLVAWGLYRLLMCLVSRRSIEIMGLAALVIGVVMAFGCALYGDKLLDRGMRENAALIEADADALEIISNAATGDIFSGVLPELYHRRYSRMDCSALSGEELARFRGTTTLMNAKEYIPFIQNGFLYTQISDSHAVYTSDKSVIQALTDAGYHLTGYYNGESVIDLRTQAESQELKYSKQDGVQLKGTKRTLTKGLYMNLFGGKYTVTFDLGLPENALKQEGTICKLRVKTEKGKNTLLEKEVQSEDFDENGKLTVSIPFTISDTRSVSFWVRAEKGKKVNVKKISYCRTPDYDVHTFYDEKMRVEREEYYTDDGKPSKTTEGFQACEYRYDENNNVRSIIYYDQNKDPVTISKGYAEIHRYYNRKKQIVREEYFNEEGKQSKIDTGYAANERAYDQAGNAIIQVYYDEKNQRTMTSEGYAEIHRTYNKSRQNVKEEYFDENGNLNQIPKGYAILEREYDKSNNIIAQRYYNEDAKLTLNIYGYAEMHRTYNGLNQVIREEYYGIDGMPVLCSDGYSATEKEYDIKGNITVQHFLGIDNVPIMITYGYAEVHRMYNGNGQCIREEYYGVDGLPIIRPYGFASQELEYDERGNVSVVRFYDINNQPVNNMDGYAEVHREYNTKRQIIHEEFYGVDGKLVLLPDGYAVVDREYDADGSIISLRRYDIAGNLVN